MTLTPPGVFKGGLMDLVQVHLKKHVEREKSLAWVDLSTLTEDQGRWLLETRVVSIPVLVRTLIAMHQNGIDAIVVQHREDQAKIRATLEHHPLIGRHLLWAGQERDSRQAPWFHRFCDEGGYVVSPNYLMNGVFLDAFEAQFDRKQASASVVKNNCAGENVFWLAPQTVRELFAKNGKPLAMAVRDISSREVTLQDPEVDGSVIATPADIRRAEKILCKDITRKKGGYLAKRFNEPISLWIAKQCAKFPLISPNFMTLVNTILGVTSAWLVFFGAQRGWYWPVALGAILFYAVDIFDGIDGELARFTFRYSKNGALYDTISDNITLLCFIIACYYAAFMHVKRFWVIGAGIYTVVASLGAVLYLAWFTTRYFGNASLRLYEARFLPMVPKSDGVVRFIEFMKHFYTKDVLCAMLSIPLLLNLPVLIALGAPLVISLMFAGFIYLGFRYAHLLQRPAL